MVIIGYSGHAYVVCGILKAAGKKITGYCDLDEKQFNPFGLAYLGNESNATARAKMLESGVFIAVGDNTLRKKIYDDISVHCLPANAIHPSTVIDPSVIVSGYGVMIAAGVCINPLAEIQTGAICNTASVIEHQCFIGAFAHIAPGAVLCGNVHVGEGAFVGAGAVVRQNIKIGRNATIGAGAVVVKDIEENEIVIGNPSRKLFNNN